MTRPYQDTSGYALLKGALAATLLNRGIRLVDTFHRFGDDGLELHPVDTAFRTLPFHLGFASDSRNTHKPDRSLAVSSCHFRVVRLVALGSTGWNGYHTVEDKIVTAEREGVDALVGRIVDFAARTELEHKDCAANKMIPRDVFDVWHRVMTKLDAEDIKFSLVKTKRPIPSLTFTDHAGKRFVLGSEPPVSVRIDGKLVTETYAQSTDRLDPLEVVARRFIRKPTSIRFSLNSAQQHFDQHDDGYDRLPGM